MDQDDDRRHARRYELWFPLRIEPDSSESTVAIGRDMSPSGVMMVSPAKPRVGAEVRVTFRIPGVVQKERHLEGVIVRVERNEDDPESLWRFKVAVQFDQELPELEAVLSAAADVDDKPRR